TEHFSIASSIETLKFFEIDSAIRPIISFLDCAKECNRCDCFVNLSISLLKVRVGSLFHGPHGYKDG
ncbi:MAG: hypothetical protein ACETWD_06225, partial [Desulfatiglandales bacterium]